MLATLFILLFACAPVLNRDLMEEGERNFPLSALRENPDAYKGRLYILGGIIVDTRLVQNGSQVEVFSLPISSAGYVQDSEQSMGRFLAVYPLEKGLLDPVIYKQGRQVTLAGVFLEARKSKIDDMDYVYPVFEIRQIHLWEEQRENLYLYPYFYPYSYFGYPYGYYPYWSSPWGPPGPGWW